MSKRVQLIRADTFEYLPDAPADSIDCVVTSPPYWDIKDYNGRGNLYGNEATLAGYRANTRLLCRGLYPVVQQTGSVWAVVGYKREAGRLIDLPALWAEDAESEGFILKQKIIWDKQNTAANGHTTRERDTHEVILHLTKKSGGYFYDIAAARMPYKNARRATAESQHHKVYRWVAQGIMTYAQSLKAHAEIDRRTEVGESNRIYGPSAGPIHPNNAHGNACSRMRGIRRDGFHFGNWNKDGAVGGNVWCIGQGGVRGLNHPCPFPVKLAWECIRRTSPPDGIVLDPFMGSGTTAIAALRLNRRFIGIEIMREHWETAKRRVREGK